MVSSGLARSIAAFYDTVRPVRARDLDLNPDVTIVTGYVAIDDVPADTEPAFRRRTRHQYLRWMRSVLSIRANMIVRVEPESMPFVEDARRGLAAHTAVTPVSAGALRASPAHAEVARIIAGGYMRGATRPNRIELKNPLYATIMFSKFTWMRDAIRANPFGTRYFLWMDGGFGHGLERRVRYRSVVGRAWPSVNKNTRMADTVLVLATGLHVAHLEAVEMMTTHNHVVAGGIWGGDARKLLQMCDRFDEELSWALSHNLLDDEQSVLSRVCLKHPDLFTMVDCSGRLRDRCYFLKYLDAN
jgi:hypothetical protein